MNKNDIEIKLLEISDLHPAALQEFNRYQVTNRVRYKDGDQYFYKDEHFSEDWDDQKKKLVIRSLQNCICAGGVVVGTFAGNKLIGFANVEKNLFGKNKEYLELPFIHVSYGYRNRGIGKKLFNLCCEKAKELGAQKLYISTHPAEETQGFYKSIGCVLAMEVNSEILAKEPLDIQLEFVL